MWHTRWLQLPRLNQRMGSVQIWQSPRADSGSAVVSIASGSGSGLGAFSSSVLASLDVTDTDTDGVEEVDLSAPRVGRLAARPLPLPLAICRKFHTSLSFPLSHILFNLI